jgi:hypothetical protein
MVRNNIYFNILHDLILKVSRTLQASKGNKIKDKANKSNLVLEIHQATCDQPIYFKSSNIFCTNECLIQVSLT